MKDSNFKVGDEVECVDDTNRSDLKNGEVYTRENISSIDNSCINIKGKSGYISGGHYMTRFKLVKPVFTSEYFSALNEKDAEKYIGKVMEFADRRDIEKDKWTEGKYQKINQNKESFFTFESNIGENDSYQFMRTCPETFQKKKVKKTIECWGNIYKDILPFVYSTENIANNAQLKNRIACVKLTGEYEVEE